VAYVTSRGQERGRCRFVCRLSMTTKPQSENKPSLSPGIETSGCDNTLFWVQYPTNVDRPRSMLFKYASIQECLCQIARRASTSIDGQTTAMNIGHGRKMAACMSHSIRAGFSAWYGNRNLRCIKRRSESYVNRTSMYKIPGGPLSKCNS